LITCGLKESKKTKAGDYTHGRGVDGSRVGARAPQLWMGNDIQCCVMDVGAVLKRRVVVAAA